MFGALQLKVDEMFVLKSILYLRKLHFTFVTAEIRKFIVEKGEKSILKFVIFLLYPKDVNSLLNWRLVPVNSNLTKKVSTLPQRVSNESTI